MFQVVAATTQNGADEEAALSIQHEVDQWMFLKQSQSQSIERLRDLPRILSSVLTE